MEKEMLQKILDVVLENQKDIKRLEKRIDKLEQEMKEFKQEVRQELEQFRKEFEEFKQEMIDWGANELCQSVVLEVTKINKKLENHILNTERLEKIKDEMIENQIEHHIYKERIHQLEKTDYEINTDLKMVKEKLLVSV